MSVTPTTVPGYSQTELGVFPADWNYFSIGELVAQNILQKPLDGNHGAIHPKSADFVSHGIPFVMANNVQEGKVDLVNCSFIRKEQADNLQKGFSYAGDVLLTHKATIGHTAIVQANPFPYIMLTPQVTYYRILDHNRLDRCYLRHFFDSEPFQNRLRTLAGGGTRAYLGVGGQLNLAIVIPPTLAEQQAIAEALGDADAWIESLEGLIAKKRHLKQAAMQQLLTGNTRLPGFEGEWEWQTLGDIVDTDPDSLSPNTADDYQFKYISLEDVDRGVLQGFSEQVFKTAPSRARRRIEFDDVLVSTVRPNLQSHVQFRSHDEDWICSTGFCVLRCRQGVSDPGFLFQQFFGIEFPRQINGMLTGSNYPAINGRDVRSLRLKCPPFEEQVAIAKVLSDMDNDIAALEAKLAKARDIKQGMMQQLLTGKIRLV